MGICGHCFVEVAQSTSYGLQGGPDSGTLHWWVVAEIAFNKNHDLRMALWDHPGTQRGWPKDVGTEVEEAVKERFIEDGRMHCDALTYAAVVQQGPPRYKDEPWEPFRGQPEALKRFVEVMALEPWLRGLRILFWES